MNTQSREIEAGGRIASVAARTDSIVFDEVVRHRHDLDRESAKAIRDGQVRDALSSCSESGRVTVSADVRARMDAYLARTGSNAEQAASSPGAVSTKI